MLQGQWVKAKLGPAPKLVMANTKTCPLDLEIADGFYRSGDFVIGVWYQKYKRFPGFADKAGKDIPLPVETFWPLDPVSGMPLALDDHPLCLDCASLESVEPCVYEDLPPARQHLTPEQIKRFVEGIA